MRRRITFALLPIAAVVVLATLGYITFWGWSALDALYMTVVTVATVGYREVRPLSAGGQLFTIAVITSGVAAATYAISQLLDVVLEQQSTGAWEERRMNKQLSQLSGHTVVAGLGRVGSVVARELSAQGVPFVVVDSCEDCTAIAKDSGWLFVLGDATEEEVLRLAGIERAGAVVSTLDSDAENLFVTVTARALNADVFIVARSSHESTEQKLLKGGANRVLTPNVIGGRRMATMVLHPTVSDYLDLVSHGQGLEFRLQEVDLCSGSRLAGLSIADARVRETTGAYILAVRHRDGRIDANPAAETVLYEGDRLVVLGTGEQVAALLEKTG